MIENINDSQIAQQAAKSFSEKIHQVANLPLDEQDGYFSRDLYNLNFEPEGFCNDFVSEFNKQNETKISYTDIFHEFYDLLDEQSYPDLGEWVDNEYIFYSRDTLRIKENMRLSELFKSDFEIEKISPSYGKDYQDFYEGERYQTLCFDQVQVAINFIQRDITEQIYPFTDRVFGYDKNDDLVVAGYSNNEHDETEKMEFNLADLKSDDSLVRENALKKFNTADRLFIQADYESVLDNFEKFRHFCIDAETLTFEKNKRSEKTVQKLEFKNIDDAAAFLNFKDKGNRYECDCPNCGQSSGYMFKETNFIKCNRENNCGVTTQLIFTENARDYIPKNIEMKEKVDYNNPQYQKELKEFSELIKIQSIELDKIAKQHPNATDEQLRAIQNKRIEMMQVFAEQRKLPLHVLDGKFVFANWEHLKREYPKLFENWKEYTFKNRDVLYYTLNPDNGLISRIHLRSTKQVDKKYKEIQLKLQDDRNDFSYDHLAAKNIFITEGVIDALSIASTTNDIGWISIPGSTRTSNILDYISANKENFRDKSMIIALDSDEAGLKARAKIFKTLDELGIAHTDLKLHQYKDSNDYLKGDRFQFAATIQNSIKHAEIQRELAKANTKDFDTQKLIDSLRTETKAILSNDKLFNEYLEFASKFPDYSFNNQLLLQKQNPNMSFVGSYSKFEEMGLQVQKGEKAYYLIVPQKYQTYILPNGDEKTWNKLTAEEKKMKNQLEKVERTSFAFRKCAFDISQTNIKEHPDKMPGLIRQNAIENNPKLFEAVKKMYQEEGIKFRYADLHSVRGQYKPGNDQITLNSRHMNTGNEIKTAIHEYAHYMLHRENNPNISKEQMEIEAESSAKIVANHFGLDTSNSDVYIAGYIKDRPFALTDQTILKRINGAAQQMIKKINTHFNHKQQYNQNVAPMQQRNSKQKDGQQKNNDGRNQTQRNIGMSMQHEY